MSEAVPSARPLRWWSPSQLAAVGGVVQRVLAAWGEDWALAASVLECVNASPDACADCRHASWHHVPGNVASGAAMCWASLGDGTIGEAVEAGLFGRDGRRPADDAAPSTMAALLAEEAVGDLAARLGAALLRREGVERGTAAAFLPTQRERPWSGAVRITLSVGALESRSIGLRLDASIVSGFAGAAPGTMRPALPVAALTPVGEAVTTHRMRIRAVFDAEGVSLRDLLALRPGDVLVTPHALEAKVSVVAANEDGAAAAPLCAGQLGSHGGRLAVALTPIAGA